MVARAALIGVQLRYETGGLVGNGGRQPKRSSNQSKVLDAPLETAVRMQSLERARKSGMDGGQVSAGGRNILGRRPSCVAVRLVLQATTGQGPLITKSGRLRLPKVASVFEAMFLYSASRELPWHLRGTSHSQHDHGGTADPLNPHQDPLPRSLLRHPRAQSCDFVCRSQRLPAPFDERRSRPPSSLRNRVTYRIASWGLSKRRQRRGARKAA